MILKLTRRSLCNGVVVLTAPFCFSKNFSNHKAAEQYASLGAFSVNVLSERCGSAATFSTQ